MVKNYYRLLHNTQQNLGVLHSVHLGTGGGIPAQAAAPNLGFSWGTRERSSPCPDCPQIHFMLSSYTISEDPYPPLMPPSYK